jgi:hypothetical protein
MNVVKLLKFTKSQQYRNAARTMDLVLAWSSIPLAVWFAWRSWPAPDSWAWLAIAAVPLSFALAMFDWQAALERWLHKVLFKSRAPRA